MKGEKVDEIGPQYYVDKYNSLDVYKRKRAEDYLLKVIDRGGWLALALMIHKEPDDWNIINRFHFTGGMWIRNALRKGGFGEDYFGIDNLDDYYACLVERAAQSVGLVKLDWEPDAELY